MRRAFRGEIFSKTKDQNDFSSGKNYFQEVTTRGMEGKNILQREKKVREEKSELNYFQSGKYFEVQNS